MLIWSLGTLFTLLVLSILLSTFLQKSKATATIQKPLISESCKDSHDILSKAITFPTISSADGTTDWKSFEDLEAYLDEAFPLCKEKLKLDAGCPHDLVYRFEGTNPDAEPGLLAAHLDVVGANEEEWTHPPFAGKIDGGYIWGRGSFDCKLQVISILQSFEKLLKDNQKPQRTWYAAFGCDEETGGEAGATLLSRYFKEKGIHFAMVLDEGGVVSQNYIKGFKQDIAVIGVAEKGYLDVQISASRIAGHSSTPDFPTSLGILSKALYRLEQHQMRPRLTASVKQMLTRLGKGGPFGYSVLFLNLWLTKPLVFSVFSKSPTLNAAIRTTMVPTVVRASDKSNVIAKQSTAQVNLRLLEGDTPDTVLDWMKNVIADERIEYTILRHTPPSKQTRIDTKAFEHLKQTIGEVFDNTLVIPYLMLGATDARKYQDVSENILRFTPARMDKTEIGRMHAPDERISTDNLDHAIGFFLRLLKTF